MPEEIGATRLDTPVEEESEDVLLKLSVKDLKRRILDAGGSVPAGPLEKADLVVALQRSLHGTPTSGSPSDQTQRATAAGVVATDTSRRKAEAETDIKPKDDLHKLSVGELKKRLFWAGSAVPAGHLEKADLVAALEKALKAAPSADKPKPAVQSQTRASAKLSSEPTRKEVAKAPEETAEQKKARQEQEEVIKLYKMSEEQLKERIVEAGGTMPQGDVGKHYLVALLKNVLGKKKAVELPSKKGKYSMDVLKEQATAEAAKAPTDEKNEPVQQPHSPSPPAAQQEEEQPAQQDTSNEVLDPRCSSTLSDDDICALSAGELKRRIREYDPKLLIGLAEKPEFIAALKKARDAGPPPRATGARQSAAQPAAPPAPAAPVELDEEALRVQMEEMQSMLATEGEGADNGIEPDIETIATNDDAGTAATETKDDAGTAATEIQEKSTVKKSKKHAKSSSKVSGKTERTGPTSGDRQIKKRLRPRCGEVTISDDEDCVEVEDTGGSGIAVPIAVDGDDCVEESAQKRLRTSSAAARTVDTATVVVPIAEVAEAKRHDSIAQAAVPVVSDGAAQDADEEEGDTWI